MFKLNSPSSYILLFVAGLFCGVLLSGHALYVNLLAALVGAGVAVAVLHKGVRESVSRFLSNLQKRGGDARRSKAPHA